MAARRDDHDWTSDLRSADAALRDDALRDDALRDLRDMLCRGLAKSLSKGRRVDDAFLEDIVQDTSVKILEKLHQFDGRSRFRTWAVTIAVRTAISKMRRRDWKDVSLESMAGTSGFNPQAVADSSLSIDQTDGRSELLGKLQELMGSELTARQLTALTADLGGMPLPQVAEQLGSNTNSVYKLLHDARKKLRHGLEAAGFTIDDVREAWA